MNRHQQRRIDQLDKLVLDLLKRVSCLETGKCEVPAPAKAETRGTAGAAASRRRDEVKAAAATVKAEVVEEMVKPPKKSRSF